MDIITGFDAKEYHNGYLSHFFAPIGLGITVRNYPKFKTEYKKLWRDIISDNSLTQTKKAYCSTDLEVLFPEKSRMLENAFVEGIKNELIDTTFFFTIMRPEKEIYSRGWNKKLLAKDYMKRMVAQYSYFCAWKHSQISKKTQDKSSLLIDEFSGEETTAWRDLSKLKPTIFYHGDMTNSLIATADVILSYLDYKLRGQRLSNDGIKRELRVANLNGKDCYLGSYDLKSITATSTLQINKESFRARPIYYLLFEDRPSEFDKKTWLQTKTYSGMFNFAVDKAFEDDGCLKIYDYDTDYRFLTNNDYFVWSGDKGEKIAKSIGKSNGMKDLHYDGKK